MEEDTQGIGSSFDESPDASPTSAKRRSEAIFSQYLKQRMQLGNVIDQFKIKEEAIYQFSSSSDEELQGEQANIPNYLEQINIEDIHKTVQFQAKLIRPIIKSEYSGVEIRKDPPLTHNSFTDMNPNFQRMIDKNGYFMDIYKFLSKEGEELNPIFDFNESEQELEFSALQWAKLQGQNIERFRKTYLHQALLSQKKFKDPRLLPSTSNNDILTMPQPEFIEVQRKPSIDEIEQIKQQSKVQGAKKLLRLDTQLQLDLQLGLKAKKAQEDAIAPMKMTMEKKKNIISRAKLLHIERDLPKLRKYFGKWKDRMITKTSQVEQEENKQQLNNIVSTFKSDMNVKVAQDNPEEFNFLQTNQNQKQQFGRAHPGVLSKYIQNCNNIYRARPEDLDD